MAGYAESGSKWRDERWALSSMALSHGCSPHHDLLGWTPPSAPRLKCFLARCSIRYQEGTGPTPKPPLSKQKFQQISVQGELTTSGPFLLESFPGITALGTPISTVSQRVHHLHRRYLLL